MNPSITTTMHNTMVNTITISGAEMNVEMMSDEMSEPSSPESSFDASDLLNVHSGGEVDDVTSQLAAAGTVGIAAAAAIASGKKRKRPHQFETNPSIRKRQQTRLLRKLKHTIEEYTTRVGQQAVVLCCTPGKSSQSINNFKVFGSQPLEGVVRNCKGVIMQDLEQSLAEQVPISSIDNSQHELPQLSIDGLPTPVDKMTQAQLRTFIPEMLKYSTGRSKPGWGKLECRPIWWPSDLPWANVRSDVRTEEDKKRVSWTEALKTIVKNCYKHHGREDLLQIFGEVSTTPVAQQVHHYPGTMVQTISNPDGTVSIIQIDTGPNAVVTLPDGTQATVVHTVNAVQDGTQETSQAVQTLAEVAANHAEGGALEAHMTPVSVEMNAETATHGVATLGEAGQIILTAATEGTDGTGIMTIPVSMYQTVTSESGIQVAMAPANQEMKNNIIDGTETFILQPKMEES